MLLTITTTHVPATDLGYLLHKNPARVQTFTLNFGKAHVFYPEATDERCTAALLLDVDPVDLSRSKNGVRGGGQPLEPYVNDRPYAASSYLSVAISQIFSSALGGRCKDKPELPAQLLPLTVRISALPCRAGGAELPERLFGALGYTVTAEPHALDTTFPEWGDSAYYTVTLAGTVRLSDLLSHLYVLIPVLDNDKHYWVGDEEVEKLLRQGEGWLGAHPERELIVRRYLKYRHTLADEALARLVGDEEPEVLAADESETAASESEEPASDAAAAPTMEEAPKRERRGGLHDQRLETVRDTLKAHGARRVLDLGCGEGKLLRLLLHEPSFMEICGMDVAHRSLQIAADKLHLDRMSERQRERLTLFQGSLIYRDKRLEGYDGAAVVEVIEHLDPSRLEAFERVIFQYAKPGVVALTTPNAEYNVVFETLPEGKMRHSDHRFEWTRAEFEAWAGGVAERHGYTAAFSPIGPEEDGVGAPSQMAVFTRTPRAMTE
ncbi:3' terminal RNA ribose 2'-O-methyltransferase Hen1 [Capsulimonas corticalis]|uniref:Small RNA 2'-O-methyltransferase n=1 Tax=Capsulimonas corticalis TaxID=2219043 RepID=A0A402CPC0_9BACT|nr:3' terminal RNA ribose 2'-O-methyltransferase Hen1 [Capsulimonas corticalis]BDI33097.1 3' terminal RNA ribose 2'-O-methyltransferase Hen1 [Capsulimonas corticalis]